jgi:hypothetical protein
LHILWLQWLVQAWNLTIDKVTWSKENSALNVVGHHFKHLKQV